MPNSSGAHRKFDYDNKDYKLVGEPDPLIVGRALED